MVISVIAFSVVDHGFEPWLGHTKDYESGIRCMSTKHTAVGSKNKDWLVRNQHIVSQERYVYPWTISVKNPIKFVWINTVYIVLLKCNLFSLDMSENYFFGVKQQSLTILLSSFLFNPPVHV
jgi:hypothetical protein